MLSSIRFLLFCLQSSTICNFSLSFNFLFNLISFNSLLPPIINFLQRTQNFGTVLISEIPLRNLSSKISSRLNTELSCEFGKDLVGKDCFNSKYTIFEIYCPACLAPRKKSLSALATMISTATSSQTLVTVKPLHGHCSTSRSLVAHHGHS